MHFSSLEARFQFFIDTNEQVRQALYMKTSLRQTLASFQIQHEFNIWQYLALVVSMLINTFWTKVNVE